MDAIFEFDDEPADSGLETLVEQLTLDEADADAVAVEVGRPAYAADGERGRLRAADFTPVRVLGQGAFGKVVLVRHERNGRLYAQKQLKKAVLVVHGRQARARHERAVLEAVRHPFVVRLQYAFQDQHKLYLVLDYVEGGELFTHLALERQFGEPAAVFYGAELALALIHLHTVAGVMYRDLKPENCLVDRRGHLVLTDFGLSKTGDGARTLAGTVEYMAPEILAGAGYGFAVDWWAFGAVVYELATGSPPFGGGGDRAAVMERITRADPPMPFYLSPDARALVTACLAKDPAERLSATAADGVARLRGHAFFRDTDWAALERRDPALVPPVVPFVTDPAAAENFDERFTSQSVLSTDADYDADIETAGSPAFAGFSYSASAGC
ncbi:kinase-like domain-containing protein [Dipodascopsis tothii]|uniref:kinase-like domain-containing protein n=1 Tax=Dipodascopsis tothii TaxID=44089 RepID=UPI0034CE120E